MARGWEVLRTGAMPGDDGQILVVDRSGGEDGRTTCVVPGRLVHQEGEPDLVRRLDRRDMENAFLFAAASEMRDALALPAPRATPPGRPDRRLPPFAPPTATPGSELGPTPRRHPMSNRFCCHRARHRPGHRRGTAMKTRREIEGLKRSWRDDPLWDLENTEGFEEHEEELRNYRLTMEARWKAAEEERERAIDAEAERIGVHGLLRLLRQTEARQQRQHEAIALLAEGRAQDAWRALSGHGEA